METRIKIEHFCVVSDIHLGNPFFKQGKNLLSFIEYLKNNQIHLCVNGDGIDLLQLSFPHLMLDLPAITQALNLLVENGISIHYIVGNHDIYLENFLMKWGGFSVVPFLDVVSGDKYIHIEHGHLHDRLFVKFPRLYEAFTYISGFFLKLFPRLYEAWDFIENYFFQNVTSRILNVGVLEEHPQYISAASEIMSRGFDAVIFGHTHRKFFHTFRNGGIFANPGSWYKDGNSYIEINHGVITMNKWD